MPLILLYLVIYENVCDESLSTKGPFLSTLISLVTTAKDLWHINCNIYVGFLFFFVQYEHGLSTETCHVSMCMFVYVCIFPLSFW